jgi:hypothetical protein
MTEQKTDVKTESNEAQSRSDPLGKVSRRGAMAAVVAALGISGLTGQVSAQTGNVGTAENPYERFYTNYVVFEPVTSTPTDIPDGALHLRGDQL